LKKILQLIDALESNLIYVDKFDTKISTSNVGWHIEHALLSLIAIASSLQHSEGKDFIWKFKFVKMIVFTTGTIPRGKAKSPNLVVPQKSINVDELAKHIQVARAKINDLNTTNKNNYFEHLYFGKLTYYETIRFIEIHTNHHLKIIRDIIKK
jgi:hypothetical protein